MKSLTNRFLKYVSINTKSDPMSGQRPSTKIQFNLLNILSEELEELGLSVDYDDINGYIYAKLPANIQGKQSIGFLAHVDTAPDFCGENVNPQIHENYDGQKLHIGNDCYLDPSIFGELSNYIGQTLITTDGTTLLGADDKAGISEIMEAISYFVSNPQIKHGDIWVGFTTDEEIGTGVDKFDVDRFGADFAYTIDGGQLGELQFENFNAASASIEIVGRNVHPGTAKDIMINSQELAHNFHSSLPSEQKPELTDNYEGFIMLTNSSGNVSKTKLDYIIRDHSQELFNEKKELMLEQFETLIRPFSDQSTITITDQYLNMKEKIENEFYIIDLATEAMENCDIKPIIEPIRGGTDGARLSFMGLPCPNIFTGGHNFHGKYEYIVEESMQKAVETIIEIIKLNAK